MKASTALFIIAAFCLAASVGFAHGPLVHTSVTTSFASRELDFEYRTTKASMDFGGNAE